jgi:dsDNA-specific endonuclease/ATPase MutS2
MRRFRNTIRHPEMMRDRNRGGSSSQFDYVLDLHGKTSDEATSLLNAVISSHPNSRILIVHGKGEGILRRRIRAAASSNPRIRKVEFGENAMIPGGDGVTVVQTK